MKKIVFMGTPKFAVPTLKKLIESTSFEIVSVYTKPHKIVRNKKVYSPVYETAAKNNIEIKTPTTLTNEEFSKNLFAIVIVAYGLLIPERVIHLPQFCINIHPSLLPRWRGAAPIEHTLLNNDKETGVAIMQVAKALDAGDIFALKKIEIKKADDYNTLNEKLSNIGAQLLIEVLKNIEKITPYPQNTDGLTYAHKIKKSLIDWSNPAEYIFNQIRAYSGMQVYIEKKLIKILKADFLNSPHNYIPGTIINKKMHIACKKGILIPLILQEAGKSPKSI